MTEALGEVLCDRSSSIELQRQVIAALEPAGDAAVPFLLTALEKPHSSSIAVKVAERLTELNVEQTHREQVDLALNGVRQGQEIATRMVLAGPNRVRQTRTNSRGDVLTEKDTYISPSKETDSSAIQFRAGATESVEAEWDRAIDLMEQLKAKLGPSEADSEQP